MVAADREQGWKPLWERRGWKRDCIDIVGVCVITASITTHQEMCVCVCAAAEVTAHISHTTEVNGGSTPRIHVCSYIEMI